MSTDLGMPTSGLAGVPLLAADAAPQTKREFTSDQEVRWCPGCGDYAVLATMQGFLPELGLRRENIVFVSGIGCSSRFPYYMNTFGMHSIHGRAPAIATGLATSRPDLSVFVVTGDGDALSIGANHLVHALRRNVNMTILLFNNRIYGLTKGQYSPTSETGKVTKSTPAGSVDTPFNPVSLALGAEASFVARAMDSDRKGLTEVLRAAALHRGTSLVEIYQNCPIFNDGAFDVLSSRDQAATRLLRLRDGEPLVVGEGADARVVVRGPGGGLEVVPASSVPAEQVVRHDVSAVDPSAQFALSRLDSVDMTTVPVGIFRQVQRPTYDDLVREQVTTASAGGAATTEALQALVEGNDTWTVGGVSSPATQR
jgi:2-oxoglutarate ferredoxin oxidoreductase subunit beta